MNAVRLRRAGPLQTNRGLMLIYRRPIENGIGKAGISYIYGVVFSSIICLFYFLPLFFLVYYLVNKKFKNPVILAGSILFYAWGAPGFIFVILGTTVVDFYIVRLMSATDMPARRKLLLCSSLCLNLGLLAYFKYSNFFVENVNWYFLLHF